MLPILTLLACGHELPMPLFEVEETPVSLDEVTVLGFSANDVLSVVQERSFNAQLTAGEVNFGDDSLSDDMMAHAPYTLGALTDPIAVLRTETYEGGSIYQRRLWIRGNVALASSDGAFDTAGPMTLSAVDTSESGVEWTWEGGGGTVGVMPTWVDERVAELAVASGTCAEFPSGGRAILGAVGPLDALSLILEVDGCGSWTNVGVLDLLPE